MTRIPRRLTRLVSVTTFCLLSHAHLHAAPFVMAYTDGQLPTSATNLKLFASNVSAVGIGSTYALTHDVRLIADGMTDTTKDIIKFATERGLPLYPTVSDFSNQKQGCTPTVPGECAGFDPAVSEGVLKTAATQAAAVRLLVDLAVTNKFAGVNVDLEAVQPGKRADFTAFLRSLSSALRVHNLKLIVSVPAKAADLPTDYLWGYDYAGIGSVVDYLQVMTYDEVGPGWSSNPANGYTWPGPGAGLDWQTKMLTYAKSVVTASKVLSGLPAYGVDYSTGLRVNWSDYAGFIAQKKDVVLGVDRVSVTPWARWGTVTPQADGVGWSAQTAQPALWYDDAASIQAKASLVRSLELGGTSVWAVGQEDASFWSAVKAGLEGAVALQDISAVAGSGGTISPSGKVQVQQGKSQTFRITPLAGYSIASVTVDGQPVGAVSSYTFDNVQTPHAIAAAFAAVTTGDGHIERSGTGHVWSRNTSATSNANRTARPALNDGVLTNGAAINAAGEGGQARWQAAGVVWGSTRTVTSVRFVNGPIDQHGNGFFQRNVSLQFSTDGTTWTAANWSLTPAYPGTSAAAGASYTFSGALRSGVRGVRVVGQTGSDSWSGAVSELEVIGR